MTRTRYTLSDLGGSLDWAALLHFVQHLDHTSALVRAMYPEHRERFEWASGEMDAAIMADLIDAVNCLRWELACSRLPKGKSKPRRIPRYPRPGVSDDAGTQTIGSDPIPVSQFDAWWESQNGTEEQGGEHQCRTT